MINLRTEKICTTTWATTERCRLSTCATRVVNVSTIRNNFDRMFGFIRIIVRFRVLTATNAFDLDCNSSNIYMYTTARNNLFVCNAVKLLPSEGLWSLIPVCTVEKLRSLAHNVMKNLRRPVNWKHMSSIIALKRELKTSSWSKLLRKSKKILVLFHPRQKCDSLLAPKFGDPESESFFCYFFTFLTSTHIYSLISLLLWLSAVSFIPIKYADICTGNRT